MTEEENGDLTPSIPIYTFSAGAVEPSSEAGVADSYCLPMPNYFPRTAAGATTNITGAKFHDQVWLWQQREDSGP